MHEGMDDHAFLFFLLPRTPSRACPRRLINKKSNGYEGPFKFRVKMCTKGIMQPATFPLCLDFRNLPGGYSPDL